MTAAKRMLITGALVLSMGLGVGVALVTAKAAHETDSLIFFTAPNILNGNVTSPKAQCEPNRKATVRKSRQGPDRKLGTDRSGGDGWYTVTTPNTITSGEYYAKIAKRDINAGVCAAAKSNTTTITGP
jgi:hypothetical protein